MLSIKSQLLVKRTTRISFDQSSLFNISKLYIIVCKIIDNFFVQFNQLYLDKVDISFKFWQYEFISRV